MQPTFVWYTIMTIKPAVPVTIVSEVYRMMCCHSIGSCLPRWRPHWDEIYWMIWFCHTFQDQNWNNNNNNNKNNNFKCKQQRLRPVKKISRESFFPNYFCNLKLESSRYFVWRDLMLDRINCILITVYFIEERLYDTNSVNISIFCYEQACIFLVVSKDFLKIVCGYSLPSAENCHNRTESLL